MLSYGMVSLFLNTGYNRTDQVESQYVPSIHKNRQLEV